MSDLGFVLVISGVLVLIVIVCVIVQFVLKKGDINE